MARVVLGGILGGIVVFLWGSVSHILLPLGSVGIRSLPNEDVVLTALRAAVPEPGFYFYPGMEVQPGMTRDEQAAAEQGWNDKIRRGPTGILIHHPGGRAPMEPGQLGTELASNILGALVAAFLLWMAAGAMSAFGARVLFVTLLGLFASLAIDVSYWNWYRFPASYTLAQMTDHLAAWFLGGLVLAAMVRKR